MFGDLILKFRTKWEQFWCIHDYDYDHPYHVDYGLDGFDIYECKKCGKHKTEKGTWLGYTGPMK